MKTLNVELIYNNEENVKKELDYCWEYYAAETITEVFESDVDNNCTICYTKKYSHDFDSTIYNIKILENESKPEEISSKEFYSSYRKFFKTRLKSFNFFIDSVQIMMDGKPTSIDVSVRFIRGPVYAVIATAVMEDEIKITDGIKAIIKDVLKAKMPNSKDGRETNITPLEISSHHSSFIFPIKKLFPRFVDFQHCKKIDELLDRENKDIAEFKWLRLKTGLVIVSNRHNEYINIITGNKIDPIYVIEEAVAYDSDLMWFISKMPITNANEFISFIESKFNKKIFNERFISYYSNRYNFIEEYENYRSMKRSLATVGCEAE